VYTKPLTVFLGFSSALVLTHPQARRGNTFSFPDNLKASIQAMPQPIITGMSGQCYYSDVTTGGFYPVDWTGYVFVRYQQNVEPVLTLNINTAGSSTVTYANSTDQVILIGPSQEVEYRLMRPGAVIANIGAFFDAAPPPVAYDGAGFFQYNLTFDIIAEDLYAS